MKNAAQNKKTYKNTAGKKPTGKKAVASTNQKKNVRREPDFADRAEEALKAFLQKLGRHLPEQLYGISTWIGDVLNEVGFYTEFALVRTARRLKTGGIWLAKKLWIVLKFLIKVVTWLPLAVLALFGRIFLHLFNAVRNIVQIWKRRDPQHMKQTWKDLFLCLFGGIARNAPLLLDLAGWVLPLAAAGLFIFTVHTVMGYEYALQLSCNGEVMGCVEDEKVFDNAIQDLESRIIYNEGDEAMEWGITPTYNLVISNSEQLLNADTVANTILKDSGKEITEATGLYLDGTFYGAITQRKRLERELEELKQPYVTGEEGEYISFVKEPELVDGIYLTSSMVDYDEISELIHGQVAGEVRYTVVKGDSPSGIAHAHDLTTAELYAMNPGLEGGGLWIGDELIISQAVPFLQVKVTYRRTEQESVPYSTVRTNTADLSYGYTKVAVAGVPGVNACEYDYVYIDGILQSKTLISTTVISEPVTEEILVGTTVKPGVTMIPSTGAYMWPVPAYRYVSRGFTGLYAHNGMDICAPYGTPIYATQSGVVTRALYTNVGYGVYVVIDHGGGYSSLYGHCSGLTVSVGDLVNQGDLIAYMGSTGNSTGNHTHFEIRINNVQVNPAPYVGYG